MDMNMKTGIGYKLFEQNEDGVLFPLFIGKSKPTPIGEWVEAENIPTKGFANRPGWHLGLGVPDAPHLKGYDGSNIGVYKSRFKNGKRVWAEVEYDMGIDYNDEVSTLSKKCFTDRLPIGGFYNFIEFGKKLVWVITDKIKIRRILTDDERIEIMERAGYDEAAEYEKYKKAFEKRMANERR